MAHILMVFSTTDGHTLTICRRLREIVESRGHRVTLAAIDEEVDPARFDEVVIGARIRYGRHSPAVFAFVARHRALLESMPNAFFSVNVVARKPGKDTPETNPYVRAFLRKSRWRPKQVDVFAGRIDYPRCGPLDRLIIRFIMWLTQGPTDPRAVVEFTDWDRVRAFGERLARMDPRPLSAPTAGAAAH